jgi:hypothetical protein
MSYTGTTPIRAAGDMIRAVEHSMARLRDRFRPERPEDAFCHACGGNLIGEYVRLRQADLVGRPIWLHIGPCLAHFASLRRRTAEARLN